MHRDAEIELRPPTGLAVRAERLRHRDKVRSVRYEPGADTLDGETADRLTWVTVREKPGPYGSPTGAWRAVAAAAAAVAHRGRRCPRVLRLRPPEMTSSRRSIN